MKTPIIVFAAIVLLTSCNRVKEGAKDTINKTGQAVGTGASEFLGGVKEGVDNTFQCTINLSDSLKIKGLGVGKFAISDSNTSKDYVLTCYLIFNKDFKQTIWLKVFDKEGKEYGRTKLDVQAAKGDAKYVDFSFDKRTDIESKSTFTME
jgi:hypothetical protein